MPCASKQTATSTSTGPFEGIVYTSCHFVKWLPFDNSLGSRLRLPANLARSDTMRLIQRTQHRSLSGQMSRDITPHPPSSFKEQIPRYRFDDSANATVTLSAWQIDRRFRPCTCLCLCLESFCSSKISGSLFFAKLTCLETSSCRSTCGLQVHFKRLHSSKGSTAGYPTEIAVPIPARILLLKGTWCPERYLD